MVGVQDMDRSNSSISVVYIPSSSSFVEAPPSWVRPASDDDLIAMRESLRMAQIVASVEDALMDEQAERRHTSLITSLLNEVPKHAEIEDVGGFYKLRTDRGNVYLSKNGRRIDLSGFILDHPAIRILTDEEARTRKLGRVRGQVIDASSDVIRDVWVACVNFLYRENSNNGE